ncbi:(2Fe-2S) ferredoxin domain-containing protein [Erythrobacter sp.]|uniref:(2Fe-2S) ferredoxin domain-containing protein n=1 Tax=Erythrobacter sp. TaxID=1042 RepID=UPI001425F21E|nr:(2Fe-2S) ferredoxin domain-containing protein [Erythrobacter sp.]QIQ86143.1 MAG: (2Fe-2S) ferredoxin domain-containing protein [Erythrobacter sp.]
MKTEIRSNWSHAILVCGKCGKKAKKRGLTFGKHDQTFRKALKAALGAKKGRKASLGLVEVPCLDICPKNGVVLVDSRTPGQWRIITPDADMDELARQLKGV